MSNWDDKAKRLLKSEMVKRGFSNADLVGLLNEIGIEETKASIDSKISRGSFSATFLLQCLTVIGCRKLEIEDFEMLSHSLNNESTTVNGIPSDLYEKNIKDTDETQLLMVAEPNEPYKVSKNET